MELYPYTCLEQRASRAVVLDDATAWTKLMASLPAHFDENGLLSYFPRSGYNGGSGSVELTAYILSPSLETNWGLPDSARAKMLKALDLFLLGKLRQQSAFPAADLTFRKLLALAVLARAGAANPVHIEAIRPAVNEWPASALIHWYVALSRMPAFPVRDSLRKTAEIAIRSRLRAEGSALFLNSPESDYLWWLMISPDADSALLVLEAATQPEWASDAAKLVNGFIGRQVRGAWSTTVANAWGVLALKRFSKNFEKESVGGTTSASLGSAKLAHVWAGEKGSQLELAWPTSGKGDLSLMHAGSGKPWAVLESRAALVLKAPIESGFTVARTITPLEQKTK